MPTAKEREMIWWQHLRTKVIHVPLADDVDIQVLSEKYEFCGREIKSAVKSACVAAALEKTQNPSALSCGSASLATAAGSAEKTGTVANV